MRQYLMLLQSKLLIRRIWILIVRIRLDLSLILKMVGGKLRCLQLPRLYLLVNRKNLILFLSKIKIFAKDCILQKSRLIVLLQESMEVRMLI